MLIKSTKQAKKIAKILNKLLEGKVIVESLYGPGRRLVTRPNEKFKASSHRDAIIVKTNCRSMICAEEVILRPSDRSVEFWMLNGDGEDLGFQYTLCKQEDIEDSYPLWVKARNKM